MIGLFVVGCKKYQNDPFISTYSPEGRLTKGDGCVWTCVKYSPKNGAAKDIPAFHYSLSFKDDKSGIAGFSVLGTIYEILDTNNWSFSDGKNTLAFFGEYQIKKLTMRELELKDSNGNVYLFEKIKNEAISKLDEGIMNVPMFGIFPEICSVVQIESCENGGISAYVGTTPMSSIEGIFGKGIGEGWTSSNATFTFGRYFSKPGYISFWMRGYSGSTVIKLNDQPITDYKIVTISQQQSDFGGFNEWYNLVVKVSSGNQNIKITSYIGNSTVGIDEIRYWEVQ